MAFPNPNKVMLLLASDRNPLWANVFEGPIKHEAIQKIMGIVPATLSNWKHGYGVSGVHAAVVFQKEKIAERVMKYRKVAADDEKKRLPQLHENAEALVSDTFARVKEVFDQAGKQRGETGVGSFSFKAASVLGISRTDCQLVIDQAIYHNYPVFLSMYWEASGRSRDTADEHLKAYAGPFLVWLRRGDKWLKATLSVRYLLEIGSGVTIRCEMVVPMISPEAGYSPYWQYDGYLVPRARQLFWMFELRQAEHGDFFHMITNSGWADFRGIRNMRGTYLTADQDDIRLPVSGDVFIQRAKLADEEDVDDWMLAAPAVIEDPAEIAELAKLVRSVKLA